MQTTLFFLVSDLCEVHESHAGTPSYVTETHDGRDWLIHYDRREGRKMHLAEFIIAGGRVYLFRSFIVVRC